MVKIIDVRTRMRKPKKLIILRLPTTFSGARARSVKPYAPRFVTTPQRRVIPVSVKRAPKLRAVKQRVPYTRIPVRRLPRPLVFPYTRNWSVYRRFYRYAASQVPIGDPDATTVRAFTYARSKTGTSLPNWQKLIRSGINATTNFSASESTVEHVPADISLTYYHRPNPQFPYALYRTHDSDLSLFSIDLTPMGAHMASGTDAKASNRAITELYRKIYKARHQLQGGVILGEIDKTARLLADTAKNLKGGVVKYLANAVGIRKGKGSNIAKSKAISRSYLEATFGWQPLIGDCKDLAKTLGRLCYESDRVRFRAGAEDEEQTSHLVSDISGFTFGTRIQYIFVRSQVIYKGFLRGIPYEIGSPPLERIISMSGFDFRSFVPTMWELVPYSFVVDYFTNIGDCLQAFCTDTSIVSALWRTDIKETTIVTIVRPDTARTIAFHTDSNSYGAVCSKTDGYSVNKYHTTTRAASAVPLLLPQLTGLDLPFRQFANLGALIRAKSRN